MKISTAQEAINGNSNDTVITPLRLKQVLNSKNIGGGGSGGITKETDPIFKASPAAKITDEDIKKWNSGTGGVSEETDPTVPDYVKQIKQEDIDRWNSGTGGGSGDINLDDISSKMSKVLYDNPDGTNGAVNLSETSANFKYLDIFFRDNDTTYSSVRVYEPDGKFADLTTLANWSKSLYVKQARYQISGSTIKPTSYSEAALTSSPSTSIVTATNMIYITKVVGYYDENVLIVGNNGTEIVNLNEPKNVMTLKLDAAVACVSGAYTHLNLSLYNSQGDKLTCENGYVKIGKGITKVRVSGQAKFETGSEGAKHIHIDVNETTVAWNYGPCIEVGQNVDAIVTPFVVDVKEGDLIDLKYYAASSDKVSGHYTCYTFLTVEAIEDNKNITVNNTIDGIPIGSEFEYDGEEVPDGYEEVIEEPVEEKDPTCYYDGDSFVSSTHLVTQGLVTSSTTALVFSIYLPKMLKNIKEVICNSLSLELRGISGYLNNESGYQEYVGRSGYTITTHIVTDNMVTIFITKSTAWTNTTNNTPIVAKGVIDLTFKE